MNVKPGYMEKCEERFGVTADALGFCDTCPFRPGFLAYMEEEGEPLVIAPDFVEHGARAKKVCPRTIQIANGECPTAEVNICPAAESIK